MFLYREVLERQLEGIDALRARAKPRLPVVLSQDDVRSMLNRLQGEGAIPARLLYGCGLRINEVLRLRVKDVDLSGRTVTVRGGKGDKDRILTLPRSSEVELGKQLEWARVIYEGDRQATRPGVEMPTALARKAPAWSESWEWFWVFPSKSESRDPRSGIVRRHHLHKVTVSRAIQARPGRRS